MERAQAYVCINRCADLGYLEIGGACGLFIALCLVRLALSGKSCEGFRV